MFGTKSDQTNTILNISSWPIDMDSENTQLDIWMDNSRMTNNKWCPAWSMKIVKKFGSGDYLRKQS